MDCPPTRKETLNQPTPQKTNPYYWYCSIFPMQYSIKMRRSLNKWQPWSSQWWPQSLWSCISLKIQENNQLWLFPLGFPGKKSRNLWQTSSVVSILKNKEYILHSHEEYENVKYICENTQISLGMRKMFLTWVCTNWIWSQPKENSWRVQNGKNWDFQLCVNILSGQGRREEDF